MRHRAMLGVSALLLLALTACTYSFGGDGEGRPTSGWSFGNEPRDQSLWESSLTDNYGAVGPETARLRR